MYSSLNCSSINLHTSLLSLLLTMDISFPFLVQTLSSFLLHDSITFLLAFSYLLSSQRYRSICGIFKEPISWSLLQILLPSSPHSKFLISLLPSLLLSFFLFFVFSSLFFLLLFLFLSLFFFSFFFCFYNPSFSYFGLYCLPYSSRYLIILTSSIFQSILEL